MPLNIPAYSGASREKAILDLILDGEYEVEWVPIESEIDGHKAVIYTFADALKIQGVRVNVCAKTLQAIADALGCRLLTPKLADLRWEQRAVTLPPFTQDFDTSTKAMLAHSKRIDEALKAAGYSSGIIETVGKNWVIDNHMANMGPHMAVNYGWHFVGDSFGRKPWDTTASGIRDPKTGKLVRLIQGRGYAHNSDHTDYSQVVLLVDGVIKLDGQNVLFDDVAVDPRTCSLLSHDGPLKVLRQPGVAKVARNGVVLPKVRITND